MEPEIPEVQVKVIEPEKELPPPTFEPTPMQVGEAPSEEVDTSAMEKAEIPESTGVSLRAEQEVGDVLEQFEKTVEGIRSTKTINPNVPLEPYPLGQQIYEQRQQFFEEFEPDEVTFPFQILPYGTNSVRVKPGFVRCFYQGDSYIDVLPELMDPGFGLVIPKAKFIYLCVFYTSYYVTRIILLPSEYDRESELGEACIKLGGVSEDTGLISNYVNTSFKFAACRFSGSFTSI